MLDRPLTKILAALAGLGLLLASFLFGFGVGRIEPDRPRGGYPLLEEAEDRVRSSSVKQVDRKTLERGAVRGLLKALDDPYAEYLDPETYRSFQDISTGHFSGVGLWLKDEEGRVKVVSVLQETPAARAGVQSGDVLTQIDHRTVEGLSLEQVVGRIKGKPGTAVTLSLLRGEQPVEFSLVREDIDVPSVRQRLLRDRIGVIELFTFAGGAGARVREAVRDLTDRGARGLILDLRGNPGGLLEESVNVASAFLEGGRIVSYRQRGAGEVMYEARPPVETKLSLVVLVDEGSASASEIVAGAIQDRGRGIVVGAETYGKGSIQTVFPLSDGSAVKVTTASYHTPSGRPIGEKGVVPDIVVAGRETQLSRAQQILREMLAERPVRQAG